MVRAVRGGLQDEICDDLSLNQRPYREIVFVTTNWIHRCIKEGQIIPVDGCEININEMIMIASSIFFSLFFL